MTETMTIQGNEAVDRHHCHCSQRVGTQHTGGKHCHRCKDTLILASRAHQSSPFNCVVRNTPPAIQVTCDQPGSCHNRSRQVAATALRDAIHGVDDFHALSGVPHGVNNGGAVSGGEGVYLC